MVKVYIGAGDRDGSRYLYVTLADRRRESVYSHRDMPAMDRAIPVGAAGFIRPAYTAPGYRRGSRGWELCALDRVTRHTLGNGTLIVRLENSRTLAGSIVKARTVYADRLARVLSQDRYDASGCFFAGKETRS